MDESSFRSVVAANIVQYRKFNGMTQLELAEKLNYSDKSVSKWERGESLPDVYLLSQIAELFGITLYDLISDKGIVVPKAPYTRKKKMIITALSCGLVWLVFSVAFFFLKIFEVAAIEPMLMFLIAVPVTFIVLTVLTSVWWGLLPQLVSVSGLIWSIAVIVDVAVAIENIKYFYLIAAVLQVLTFLWFYLRNHLRKYNNFSREIVFMKGSKKNDN